MNLESKIFKVSLDHNGSSILGRVIQVFPGQWLGASRDYGKKVHGRAIKIFVGKCFEVLKASHHHQRYHK